MTRRPKEIWESLAPAYVLLARRAEDCHYTKEFKISWTCVRLNEVPRLPRDYGSGEEIMIDQGFCDHSLVTARDPYDMMTRETSHVLKQLIHHAVHKGCAQGRRDEYLLMPELQFRQAREATADLVNQKNREVSKVKSRYDRIKAVIESRKDRPRLP